MLFDLRGRGRRRTIQVIYLGLAVLIGGGLIGFGIGGGAGGGGLLNAVGQNGGSGNATDTYASSAKAAQKKVTATPKDPTAWAEFLEFTVDPKSVTVKTSGLDVRFNHSFEVVDAAGRIHESIDAKARTGDLDALWKLVRTRMAWLEMDPQSFRIGFEDGSIIRSRNQLDVRRPDLEQVDYWLAADDSSNSPLPNDPQHYPANLVT